MNAPQQKPSAHLGLGAHTRFLPKRQILNSFGFANGPNRPMGQSVPRIKLSWRSEASQTHDRWKPSQPTDPQETARGQTPNRVPASVWGKIWANQTHIQ